MTNVQYGSESREGASGIIAATLFTWIQGADFYYDLHKAAVELLPCGTGNVWIDVGCGPGLVARLAAQRGYRVTGIDTNAQMIQTARRLVHEAGLTTEFKTGDVFDLPTESAEVVSAASLLAVLGDKPAGLRSLWQSVRPGGRLLVIEPTAQMTLENANRAINNGLSGKRINGLRLWATVRQGNAVEPSIYERLGAESVSFTPLLQGMVGAWVILKN